VRETGKPIAHVAHNREIAHTMGLVTFSLFNLLFSITARDERKTIFSGWTWPDIARCLRPVAPQVAPRESC